MAIFLRKSVVDIPPTWHDLGDCLGSYINQQRKSRMSYPGLVVQATIIHREVEGK